MFTVSKNIHKFLKLRLRKKDHAVCYGLGGPKGFNRWKGGFGHRPRTKHIIPSLLLQFWANI
jgi:hypothetical protein